MRKAASLGWVAIGLLAGILLAAACARPTPTPTRTPASPTPTRVSATRTPLVEAMPTMNPLGALEVRVTDAPAAKDVTKVLLTLKSVQVHRSAQDAEQGWVTVVTNPAPFDLKALTGVEQILGATQMEVGQYQQVRLEVVEAKVTVDGEEVQARVPSQVIKIVGGFTVTAGEATVLTLDFDAGKSVVIAGPNVNLKPSVKLLVRKGGQPPSQSKEVGKTPDESGPPEAPSPTVAPAPTATPTVAAPTATATVIPSPTATQAPTVSSNIQNFTLENLTIRMGATVTWTNRDGVPHTSTSGSGNPPTPSGVWNTGILNNGQSSNAVTFDQAGSFPYFCEVHPTMTATVTVVQ